MMCLKEDNMGLILAIFEQNFCVLLTRAINHHNTDLNPLSVYCQQYYSLYATILQRAVEAIQFSIPGNDSSCSWDSLFAHWT